MAQKIGSILIDLKADTSNLVKGMNKAQSSVKNAVKGMKTAIAGLAIGAAFKSAITTGIKYNKVIEEQTQSITALIAATSKQEDAMGNSISVTELYTRANAEAVDVLGQLEEINKSTPHTLGQTAQIYKTMLPSMKGLGVSTAELVQMTKKLSIAAGAGGVQFQSLLAGVDGLATGTVLANSDLGRFLSTIGLSNEALKESTDVVGLFEDKLGSFQAPDTMQVAISNLENAWGKFMGTLTSDSFQAGKKGLNALAEHINKMTAGLEGLSLVSSATWSKMKDGANLVAAALRASFSGLTDGIARGFNLMLSSIQLEISDLLWSLKDLPRVGDDMRKLAMDMNLASNLSLERANQNKKAMTIEKANILEAKAAFDVSFNDRILKYAKEMDAAKASAKAQATVAADLQKSAAALKAEAAAADELAKKEKKRIEDAIALKKKLRNEFESMRDGYDKEGAAIRKIESNILKLETALKSGIITQKEFNTTISNMGEAYNQAQLDANKATSQMEDDVAELSKNISSQLEGAMTNTFRQWLDGAKNFSDLFKSLLKDIATELFRVLVIKKAVEGVSSSLGFANGGVISGGNVVPFASGGVVNSPTNFAMSGGKTGLMGEAGPEAIMPLTRMGGDLGVKVDQPPMNVNVINNGNDEVAVQQDENGLTILIEQIENSIASGMVRGTSPLGNALNQMKGQGRL